MLVLGLIVCAACGNTECDTAAFAGVCNYGTTGGECVEFTGLSTADSKSASAGCANRGGVWDAGAGTCAAAAEVGVCDLPPTAPNIDIGCSPKGVIHAHFYQPFTLQTAQQTCSQVDAGFTPG
jgi:hypothetical protein